MSSLWQSGHRRSRRGSNTLADELFVQVNYFRTAVDDSVANVTFDPGPPLILRQRRNAGQITSQGIETEAVYRLKRVSLTGGYLFLDSKVTEFIDNPGLVGLRIPQVPVHQGTLNFEVAPNSDWLFAIQGRASSRQFDDDLNQLDLGPAYQIDFYGSRRFERVRAFFAVQNLTNRRNQVRLTPVRVLSAPIGVRAGISWK